MIKHIVMWRLKEENKAENAQKIKEALEGLSSLIPGIIEIEVGIADNEPSDTSADVILYSTFASQADLDAYQKHPAHQEAGGFVKTVAVERRMVDYIV